MPEKILPGIFRMKIPLPRIELDHLNSYLIKTDSGAILVDTGMDSGEAFNKLNDDLKQLDIELFFTGKRPERDYTEEDGKDFNPTPILAQVTNMAARLLNKDVTLAKDLDTGMKLGTGWPKGPLEWADETGIDKVAEKLEKMRDEFGDESYEPNSLLKEMIDRNKTGKEAGEGFYKY